VIAMVDCKEQIEKLDKDVKQIKDLINELSEDTFFFLKQKDKVKDVFSILEKEFSEAKSCEIPAVKVDGECKDTSLLLEPVLGKYVPSENIFDEIKVLIDAGAVGKLKDKISELEAYLDSVVGGFSCPVDETKTVTTKVEMPKIIMAQEEEEEDNTPELPLDVEADAQVMITEAEYMKLARKKPRNETSKRRQWYKECMSEKLKGKKKGMSRVEWREFFKQAAKECKAENPYPKKKGGE